jgi:hypothetical protein
VGSQSPVAATSIRIASRRARNGAVGKFLAPTAPRKTRSWRWRTLSERTSHHEHDDKQNSEPEDSDSVGSSADEAKERELEMEESGEENAG